MSGPTLINEGPYQPPAPNLQDMLWRVTADVFRLVRDLRRTMDDLEAIARMSPRLAGHLSSGRMAVLRFAHGTLQGMLDQLDRLRESALPLPPEGRS